MASGYAGVLFREDVVRDFLGGEDARGNRNNLSRFRPFRYLDRFAGLIMVIPPNLPALRWVTTAINPNDKLETFEELKESGGIYQPVYLGSRIDIPPPTAPWTSSNTNPSRQSPQQPPERNVPPPIQPSGMEPNATNAPAATQVS